MVAERSYLASEIRRGGHECQAVTAQKQPGGATPSPKPGAVARKSYWTPRPGVVAERSNPTSKEQWLLAQEGREELLHIQDQEGRQ